MQKINKHLAIVLVFTTLFLCCMITMGASFLKKLYVLLAVLLCSVLVGVPFVSYAGPVSPATQYPGVQEQDDSPFTLTAGEVSSGDAEAVLQLDKTLLDQLIQSVLQHAYPAHSGSPVISAFYSFTKRDCWLHTILIKGP